MSFPGNVDGLKSPYPTVVRVIKPHQNESRKDQLPYIIRILHIMPQMSLAAKNVCKLIQCYLKTVGLPWGYLSLRSIQD